VQTCRGTNINYVWNETNIDLIVNVRVRRIQVTKHIECIAAGYRAETSAALPGPDLAQHPVTSRYDSCRRRTVPVSLIAEAVACPLRCVRNAPRQHHHARGDPSFHRRVSAETGHPARCRAGTGNAVSPRLAAAAAGDPGGGNYRNIYTGSYSGLLFGIGYRAITVTPCASERGTPRLLPS